MGCEEVIALEDIPAFSKGGIENGKTRIVEMEKKIFCNVELAGSVAALPYIIYDIRQKGV